MAVPVFNIDPAKRPVIFPSPVTHVLSTGPGVLGHLLVTLLY
jgi:hypothetical protein